MTDTAAASRRTIRAWAFYDFANSAFTTLVVTFIYGTYFVKEIAPDDITGTVLWSRGVTISALLIALLAPFLGAVADQGGYRKRLMLLMTVICVGATVGLYFPLPGQTVKALVWFVIANIAFEMGIVFYNAYLPGIAPPGKIGRTSGFGWGVGYVGGLAAMLLAMVALVSPETPWFGISKVNGANIRATNLLVAAWFAIFAIPSFLVLKETRGTSGAGVWSALAGAGQQLVQTLREIRRYRQVGRLLLARMIYNDGLTTIFAFGGIYAMGTFGFSFPDIMIFGIVMSIGAGAGAFLVGTLDDRRGGKWTIMLSIIGLLAAILLALLTTSKTGFWVAGIMIGLMSGPNQSASRSLMGRFTPPRYRTEFFGFYAFSGKATAFLGPLLLGILTEAFQSQRAGISVVALLFAIGGWILWRVDEDEGIRVAGED